MILNDESDDTDLTFTYVISGREILIEEQRIMTALMKGGYDPTDLSFDWVAAQAKVREIQTKAEELNIEVDELSWEKPDYKGDVEVDLWVRTETDLMALKLALA
jgi:hypothetical protein